MAYHILKNTIGKIVNANGSFTLGSALTVVDIAASIIVGDDKAYISAVEDSRLQIVITNTHGVPHTVKVKSRFGSADDLLVIIPNADSAVFTIETANFVSNSVDDALALYALVDGGGNPVNPKGKVILEFEAAHTGALTTYLLRK